MIAHCDDTKRVIRCSFVMSDKASQLKREMKLLPIESEEFRKKAAKLKEVNDQIAEIRKRAEQRESKSQLAREFGICRATLYKYLEACQDK